MTKDFIFLGGAKGVGKTIIADKLSEIIKYPVINTGEIYINSKLNNLNAEEEICNYLINNPLGIIDTHYAGQYSFNTFCRGLSKERLLKLSFYKSIELILLDLDEESLFKRRETKDKKYRNKDVARLELKMNKYYFNRYCKDLLTSGLIVINDNIEKTIKTILEYIK